MSSAENFKDIDTAPMAPFSEEPSVTDPTQTSEETLNRFRESNIRLAPMLTKVALNKISPKSKEYLVYLDELSINDELYRKLPLNPQK